MARPIRSIPRSRKAPGPTDSRPPAVSTQVKSTVPPEGRDHGRPHRSRGSSGGVSRHCQRRHGAASRLDKEVTVLLAGIPQHARNLGYPNAPVTLEVFADLKDPDSRGWFDNDLPAIIKQDVRTGLLQLQFRSFKTNTRSPVEFVDEQTAALAAGAQNKLWNYADTFYHQHRNAPEHSEFEPYATDSFLQSVARQVPGLSLTRWQADRHTERREEQPSQESKAADEYQLHVTPSFRIGHTGGPLTNYSGSTILKYLTQNPISLIKAQDINETIKERELYVP